jgi:hypothetical protein
MSIAHAAPLDSSPLFCCAPIHVPQNPTLAVALLFHEHPYAIEKCHRDGEQEEHEKDLSEDAERKADA